MKQQADKYGIIITLLFMLVVTQAPIWVIYISGADAIIKNLYGLIVCLLFFFLPLYLSRQLGHWASFDKTFLPAKKRHYFIIPIGIVLWFYMAIVISCIITEIGFTRQLPYSSNEDLLFVNWLEVVLLFPIAEEIFWRGYVLDQLKKIMHSRIALILHALLWSFAHIPAWGILCIGPLFVGLLLGYFRMRYRALLPLMVIHIVTNGLIMLPVISATISSKHFIYK